MKPIQIVGWVLSGLLNAFLALGSASGKPLGVDGPSARGFKNRAESNREQSLRVHGRSAVNRLISQ